MVFQSNFKELIKVYISMAVSNLQILKLFQMKCTPVKSNYKTEMHKKNTLFVSSLIIENPFSHFKL